MRNTLPSLTTCSLLLALSSGCSPDHSLFSFQNDYGEELGGQTFALGAELDLMVWGPPGFDMNGTLIKAAAPGAATSPVQITEPRSFLEAECVMGKGVVAEEGAGDIIVATLAGLPLDRVRIAAEPVADLVVVPGSAYGPYRGGDSLSGTVSGGTISALADSTLSLEVAALGPTGTRLSGSLGLDLQSNLSFENWKQEIWLDNIEDGWLEVSTGSISSRVEIDAVEEAEILDLRIERTTHSAGSMGEMGLGSDVTVLRVVGLTADGREVSAIEAEWFVSGSLWGHGDIIEVWGENTSGRACWNGHCASF